MFVGIFATPGHSHTHSLEIKLWASVPGTRRTIRLRYVTGKGVRTVLDVRSVPACHYSLCNVTLSWKPMSTKSTLQIQNVDSVQFCFFFGFGTTMFNCGVDLANINQWNWQVVYEQWWVLNRGAILDQFPELVTWRRWSGCVWWWTWAGSKFHHRRLYFCIIMFTNSERDNKSRHRRINYLN